MRSRERPDRYRPEHMEHTVNIQDTVQDDETESEERRVASRRPATSVQDSPEDAGEMSPISGYLLMVFGALDDLLDFFAGYFPGITSIISFFPTTGQVIVVALDPFLRKQKMGGVFKLFLKRGLLIMAVWAVESLPIVNLLPLQTAAAFVVGRLRAKQKSVGTKPDRSGGRG